ncbi:MAG: hypothetical protein WCZ89_04015 [Phycisphaerae bacterium]
MKPSFQSLKKLFVIASAAKQSLFLKGKQGLLRRFTPRNDSFIILLFFIVTVLSIFLTGCEAFRFAPTEIQKQNAYLHQRTTKLAADTAKTENTSAELQNLTNLSNLQSKSFTAYFGLPKEIPDSDSIEEVLSRANFDLAASSLRQSGQRPQISDFFTAADSLFDLAIGIAALAGGAFGVRFVRFLNDAKVKSQALKEVIQGGELFKTQNPQAAEAFKQAQILQSPETRKLVTEIKL